MLERDLDAVLDIERLAFATPWTLENFRFELRDNPFARNLVLRGDRLLGYACLWVVDRELKINNVAVHPDHRRRGLGRLLVRGSLDLGEREGCDHATLEVRPSNVAARRLYEGFGFRATGHRRGYYQDTHEDAILMAATLVPSP